MFINIYGTYNPKKTKIMMGLYISKEILGAFHNYRHFGESAKRTRGGGGLSTDVLSFFQIHIDFFFIKTRD